MNDENNNLKEEQISLIATIGSLIFTTCIVLGIMFVFASIMRPFGFSSDSLFDIILYFSFALLISYPLQKTSVLLASVFMLVNKISRKRIRITSIIISIATNYISLYGVNHYMHSITTTNIAILVMSVTLASLSIK